MWLSKAIPEITMEIVLDGSNSWVHHSCEGVTDQSLWFVWSFTSIPCKDVAVGNELWAAVGNELWAIGKWLFVLCANRSQCHDFAFHAGNPVLRFASFRTNQRRCGHQTRSDWPFFCFSATSILNLDHIYRTKRETTRLWTPGTWNYSR